MEDNQGLSPSPGRNEQGAGVNLNETNAQQDIDGVVQATGDGNDGGSEVVLNDENEQKAEDGEGANDADMNITSESVEQEHLYDKARKTTDSSSEVKVEPGNENIPLPGEGSADLEETKTTMGPQDQVSSDYMFTSRPQMESTISMSSLQKQTHTIVLPSYSAWFDMKKIHKIEKESLPEFFNGTNKNKTPQIYARYRNFMVNTYRLNPNEYLSFTAVRRNLVGDAGTLLRLHKFLDKWGIINYQVNPETRPVPLEPPYTGEFTVDFDTPRGLFPFESYKPPVDLPDMSKVKELLNSGNNGSAASNGEPNKRRKIIKPDINKGWSQTDLEKLVEGVKQFPNEWYKIAEHVGNKSPEQCIIRFLQFPIEDEFLEKNREHLGPLKYVPNLSFSPNDNPIMSTLAFLTSIVDTEAAVAAADRAKKVVDDKLTQLLDGSGRSEETTQIKDEPKEDTNEEQDNMEVEDPLTDVKDAANTSFGLAAARSHVFANYEEREMNKAMTAIVNNELKLVELKLTKLSKLDRLFEFQKKQLSKKNDELFLDRLSFFKTANTVSSKLMQAIELLEDKSEGGEKLKKLVSDARELIMKPPKKSLNVLGFESKDEERSLGEEEVKPVSYEAPQLYRYWSG
ncbi:hypothetical protein KL932_003215 [Ogataea haglerorum]|uniref:Uncharacterized protein n=1 Tax=Ogataea haglerorum TaxID=1937702 RepID=A0ABQ7RI47_9ASCO|nr:uncharacterized protein KL911_002458 [Ogataea haglerorum]KAG7696263.1 hypothetical protein KL915_002627 [Ogataea haglerorum]KAG7706921.1 hypothetical protein KL914_002805 [Ogataea haglerorum]KAG7739952.1 hypothetical protein KL932_003215 [Ogataea haglerorum]KAG7748033.1 hypothetical protein KL912_002710 [Ogataea haglerorum]KAG7753982.1 hypothetical protein KL911_002458 [Ogataea haglerorum]